MSIVLKIEMNFLFEVQCHISFSLEDYDELPIYISAAF